MSDNRHAVTQTPGATLDRQRPDVDQLIIKSRSDRRVGLPQVLLQLPLSLILGARLDPRRDAFLDALPRRLQALGVGLLPRRRRLRVPVRRRALHVGLVLVVRVRVFSIERPEELQPFTDRFLVVYVE